MCLWVASQFITSATEVVFIVVCVSVCLCAKYLKKLRTDFDDIVKEECLHARDKSISFWRESGIFHGSSVIF